MVRNVIRKAADIFFFVMSMACLVFGTCLFWSAPESGTALGCIFKLAVGGALIVAGAGMLTRTDMWRKIAEAFDRLI